MLIPLADLVRQYGLNLTGAVHVGGHTGQEAALYADLGIRDVLWVEANEALIGRLRAHVEPFGHRVVHACIAESVGRQVTFHVTDSANRTNNGQSSSILKLGTHREAHPEVKVVREVSMTTTTLDAVMAAHWPDAPDGLLLSADLQGAELLMLQGAESTLGLCAAAVLEANCDLLYESCGLLPDVDGFMVAHGFEIVTALLAGCQRRDCSDGGNRWVGWGDIQLVRKNNPRLFSETHPAEFQDWCP